MQCMHPMTQPPCTIKEYANLRPNLAPAGKADEIGEVIASGSLPLRWHLVVAAGPQMFLLVECHNQKAGATNEEH
jgi:hypothetical protein